MPLRNYRVQNDALLSIIGSRKRKATDTNPNISAMLSFLNTGIKTMLKQNKSKESSRAGMDIAWCAFEYVDPENPASSVRMRFADASRPVWILRKNAETIRRSKRPSGRSEDLPGTISCSKHTR